MGRKYGHLVQLMLSKLNVNMSTKQVSFYNPWLTSCDEVVLPARRQLCYHAIVVFIAIMSWILEQR